MKSFKFLLRLFSVFGLLMIFSMSGSAAEVAFNTPFYKVNLNGDMTTLGNTIIWKDTASANQYGVDVNTSLPTDRNNAYTMKFVDVLSDGAVTFNSSSSSLNLPAGYTVKWAGLYWQGHIVNTALEAAANNSKIGTGGNANAIYSDAKSKANTVYFKLPSGLDYNLTAQAYYDYPTDLQGQTDRRYLYSGFYDVTNYVKAAGNGSYTVGNLRTSEGLINTWGGLGGWAMVVVYEDPSGTLQLKNISLFHGYRVLNSGQSQDINVSGFYTPPAGTINASLAVFVADGDKLGSNNTGEHLKMWNTSNVLTDINNSANPLLNVFNSSITNFGVDNITRTPNFSDNLGIDIDRFNVSSYMSYGQSSTKIQVSTAGDLFTLNLIAFATDVYQPNICYVENIFKGTTNISGIGAQVNKDENLTVRVYVKNTGNEVANNVQISHQFDTSFPYTVNSANYNNSNPAYQIVMPPSYTRTNASDSSGNDLFEYDSGSLLEKINLGVGATSSSGGTFNPSSGGTPTYAVFEYNATVKVLDSNYSNVYKAAYVNSALGIDYSANPITLSSCDGSKNSFYGYSAPVSVTGDFNVVYATNANGALSSGYNYNLPTAIASRADNYKVIALNTGTDILKDMNTTVAVELVDVDSSANCSSRTALNNRVWVKFNNQNETNFTGDTIVQYYDSNKTASTSSKDEEFYQKAGKNVAFRISVNTDASNNLIQLTTLNSGLTKLTNFPNFMQGQQCGTGFVVPNGGSNQIATWCANNGLGNGQNGMTQSELFTCMECIFGINTQKVCSKDNFAIRPEAFYIKLSDQNQTNGATKQVMSNNISGAVSLNLASGYQYVAEVNATNHVDNNATFGYTTTEGLDSIWTPGATVVTGCNDDTNKSSVLNFVHGLVEANLSVDQVGKYSLNITDDTWANVDSNVSTMTHHTSPLFLSGTDCTVDSAVTSTLGTYNGCNISSNHVNSDAGITYVDTSVEYRPYDFNLTSIQMSRGQNFAGTIMGQNTWTYMNHVNVDENMSVRYFGPIRAEGKSGTLLSNFVNNCYSQPINFELNLTFPAAANLQNWRYRLQEVNASNQIWNDTNAAFLSPISSPTFNLLTVPASSFLKAQNGLIDVNLSVNFDRNQTTTINPITVGLNNFQIKCNSTVDCSSRADFSTTHLPDRNVTTDNNTTFVYGRILPRDVRVFGSVPFTANGWYEVFNSPSLIATNLPASKNDATWYTNILHNDVSDGDANVTAVLTATSTPLPVSSVSNATGIESYLFSAETPTYSAKAHILTVPWLWYGMNASAYVNPGTDCLTHPCFNINVVPAVGATGSAKTGAETKKASKKSTSEAGAGGWKSTSDYAPAIR